METLRRLLEPCAFFFWTVAARGRRDAKRGRPRETDFVNLNEGRTASTALRGSTNGDSGDHSDQFDNDCGVRLAPYEHVLIAYTETAIDRIQYNLGRAKARAVSDSLRCRHRLDRLLAALEKILSDCRKKGFREPDRVIPRALYVPAMIVLGLSEFIFNLSAFEWLKVGDLETVLIAAGLGLATPLGAHCFGTALRQSPRDWRTILMTALMVGFLLPGMWSVAWLRQQFLLDQAKSLGISLTESAAWSQFALLWVNLFIFAFSVGLAFFAHDQDRDLERLWREMRRSWRRVERCWKRWSRHAVQFNKEVARAAAEKDRLQDSCIAAIAEFRDHNIRNREDSGPSWFRTAVTRNVFRDRDFGAFVEEQPPPLGEILESIGIGEPFLQNAHRASKGNGADEPGVTDERRREDHHASI